MSLKHGNLNCCGKCASVSVGQQAEFPAPVRSSGGKPKDGDRLFFMVCLLLIPDGLRLEHAEFQKKQPIQWFDTFGEALQPHLQWSMGSRLRAAPTRE